MKKLALSFFRGILKFVNLFFRPMRLKDQVVIISRQSDTETMDIRMLREGLEKLNIDVKVLCKQVNGLAYAFHILKQMKYLNSSKVVVLDTHCIPASIIPKKEGQKIVQIWHALGAIKKFGWQSVGKDDGRGIEISKGMRMHEGYDYVLAPSKKTEEFFREAFNTDAEFVRLGLPRIDYLRNPDGKTEERIREEYPVVNEKINVLYVPTFRRNAALELKGLVDIMDFSKFNLIIKKHFLDKGDYSFAREKGAIVDDKFSSFEWFTVSNKIVTDYSAISLEAAIAGKELIIYQPDMKEYAVGNGLNMHFEEEAIKPYFAADEKELMEVLSKDYDMNLLEQFKDKYFEIDMDDCTMKLCSFVKSLLNYGRSDE